MQLRPNLRLHGKRLPVHAVVQVRRRLQVREQLRLREVSR